jgi:hypothetical protein
MNLVGAVCMYIATLSILLIVAANWYHSCLVLETCAVASFLGVG